MIGNESVPAAQTQPGIPGVDVVGPIAVVPIAGAIVEDPYSWEHAFEVCTPVDWIAATLHACAADDTVAGVVVNISSPGGETGRFAHAADAMAALRDAKPVVAYINGVGLSAAYWLASMAHGVWADSPWAYTGMISTFATVADTSEHLKKLGVTMRYATDTPRKVELNDGVPITDEAVAHLASVIEPNARAFRETVAVYRGIEIGTDSQPNGASSFAPPFDGRIYSAEQGVPLGLIDEIVPAARVIERAASLFDQLVDAADQWTDQPATPPASPALTQGT